METPSNPGMKLVDIQRVAEIARRRKDVLLAIDNTFLSPYFQVYLSRDIVKPFLKSFLDFEKLFIHWTTEAIGIRGRYCYALGH
jgi:hypothetical protein